MIFDPCFFSEPIQVLKKNSKFFQGEVGCPQDEIMKNMKGSNRSARTFICFLSSGDFFWGLVLSRNLATSSPEVSRTLGQTKKLLKQLSKEEMGQGIDGMKHLQIRRINS